MKPIGDQGRMFHFRFSQFLLHTLLALGPATAFCGQADLINDADKLDNKSDHDSEDRAVEKGFDAFADLAALNIGGAISNGKQAYQSYQNSKEFERISREANRRSQLMKSGGTVQVRAARERKHILGSMDRSRLYSGSIGEAAGRAEKAFGWNRNQMFEIAVSWEKKVLAKLGDEQTITGSAFGEVVEEARKLIPLVPNTDTRKTLEKVSAIITPSFAEATLGRIAGDQEASTIATVNDRKIETGDSEATMARADAVAVNSNPTPAQPEENLRPGSREIAQLNLKKALENANPEEAAKIAREEIDAHGSPILGVDARDSSKLLSGLFLPAKEKSIFQMIRTQTGKFQKKIYGPHAAVN